jgi:hypothetical protein
MLKIPVMAIFTLIPAGCYEMWDYELVLIQTGDKKHDKKKNA